VRVLLSVYDKNGIVELARGRPELVLCDEVIRPNSFQACLL
jgi:hypothetical protein